MLCWRREALQPEGDESKAGIHHVANVPDVQQQSTDVVDEIQENDNSAYEIQVVVENGNG
jgi:hypothetical protein